MTGNKRSAHVVAVVLGFVLALGLATLSRAPAPPAALAAASGAAVSGSACSQWNISGTWQYTQSNNYAPTLTFQQSGTSVSGSFTLSPSDQARGNYVSNSITFTGTLIGSQLQFTTGRLTKNDGSASQGRYTGTVLQGQILNGTAQDLLHPGSTATWTATGPTACVSGSGGGTTATSNPAPPPSGPSCRGSQLVLLQGLSTDSSSATAYFGDIETALKGKASYSGIVNFSYNPNNPSSYTEQDSLESLSSAVDALHRTVSRLIGQCNGVTIDLVGHSMGGVVALTYLATYGPNTSEGAHIRHLLTLDSPVNGISADEVSTYVQAAALLAYDLSSLQSSAGVQDLFTLYNDPNTPQRNINLAQSLSSSMVVKTFGSDDDLIVPYSSAAIPGFDSEWQLGTISNLCPTYPDACVGHNQILHDPGVLAQIVSLLRSSPGG